QGNGGSNPQNEDQWIHQEVFPAEIGAQGVGERQYIHHGQLGRGVPANPDQGEQQKANTKASVEHLVFCQRVLEEEDSAQGQQRHQQHGNLYLLASPDLLVQRLAGGFQVIVLCGFGGCCSGCWWGRRQVGVRKLVIQVQRDKGFVFDAKRTLYQQLQSQGQNRVKGGGGRALEQGGF